MQHPAGGEREQRRQNEALKSVDSFSQYRHGDGSLQIASQRKGRLFFKIMANYHSPPAAVFGWKPLIMGFCSN
jgi:hypothetical protein